MASEWELELADCYGGIISGREGMGEEPWLIDRLSRLRNKHCYTIKAKHAYEVPLIVRVLEDGKCIHKQYFHQNVTEEGTVTIQEGDILISQGEIP